jgi:hypothetical protein
MPSLEFASKPGSATIPAESQAVIKPLAVCARQWSVIAISPTPNFISSATNAAL